MRASLQDWKLFYNQCLVGLNLGIEQGDQIGRLFDYVLGGCSLWVVFHSKLLK
jgi:hypothetical protein